MASLDLNSEVLWLLNIMDWFKEAILITSSAELFVWVMFSHTGQDKLSLVTLKPSRSCSRCSSFVSGQYHFACWYFLYLMLLWWTSGLKWLLCVLLCFSLSVWKMTVYNEKTNLLLKEALRWQEGAHTQAPAASAIARRKFRWFCLLDVTKTSTLFLLGMKCDRRDSLCPLIQSPYWSLPYPQSIKLRNLRGYFRLGCSHCYSDLTSAFPLGLTKLCAFF